MKVNKEFRGAHNSAGTEDSMRKAHKLDPIKKSGKERHAIYGELEDDDDEDMLSYRKRESVLDYFDDEE